MITNVRSKEMLDVLLAFGADLNAKSRWLAGGFGLLHSASTELAAYAIERGAIVDVHAAAQLSLLDRLRELVKADPELVHARGGDGQTPLHFAATVEIASYLLDHGATSMNATWTTSRLPRSGCSTNASPWPATWSPAAARPTCSWRRRSVTQSWLADISMQTRTASGCVSASNSSP